MVRFNDKQLIEVLDGSDIIPMTDISDSDEDKKVTVEKLSQYTIDNISTLSEGLGLSSNDFTDELKTKLENVEEGAEVNAITSITLDNEALPISDKSVAINLKTINNEKISGTGNIEIKASPDLDETTITLNDSDELQAIGVIDKNSSEPKYDWVGTYDEWVNQSISVEHPEWICYITDDYEDVATQTSSLEVCDIGISLFVDESKGLRRYLNGSIVDINKNTQGFLDRLKQIIALYPSLSCFESEWQSIANSSAFGQCGKFVINEADGTIRLPRIVMPIQGLTDLTKLGEIVQQGLPNISGEMNATANSITGSHDSQVWTSGVFTKSGVLANKINYGATSAGGVGTISFDASRSSSIYKDGSNVQQEQIQYPYFIQIATGQETQVDIVNEIELNNPYSLGDSKYSPNELDNISWLASKGQWNSETVYADFYNAYVGKIGEDFGLGKIKASTDTYTDYDLVINTADRTFRLPLLDGSEDLVSDRYDNLTLQASSSDYTAPANGLVSAMMFNSTMCNLHSRIGVNSADYQGGTPTDRYAMIPVKKGDVFSFYYNGTVNYFRFIYAKGNGTLYYYVGEIVQNANLIDAGRIQEQLPSKVDLDANNLSTTGKDLISGLAFPSDRYIDLTLGASGTIYTAPAKGWVYLSKTVGSDWYYAEIYVIDDTGALRYSAWDDAYRASPVILFLPVRRGDRFGVGYNATGATNHFRFIYAEGAN